MKKHKKRAVRKAEAILLTVFLFVQMLPMGFVVFSANTEAAEPAAKLECTVTVSAQGEGSVTITDIAMAPEPTEPAITLAPTEPAVTLAPTEPAVTLGPTEPAVTLAPTEPAVTLGPTEPAVTLGPTEPAVTLGPTEPAVTLGPTEPAVTRKPDKPDITEEPTAEPGATKEPTPEPSFTDTPAPDSDKELSGGASDEEPGGSTTGEVMAFSLAMPDDIEEATGPAMTEEPSPEPEEPSDNGESFVVTPGSSFTMRLTPGRRGIRAAGIWINGEEIKPEDGRPWPEDNGSSWPEDNGSWCYSVNNIQEDMQIICLFEPIKETEEAWNRYAVVDGREGEEGNRFVYRHDTWASLSALNGWEIRALEDENGVLFEPWNIRQTIRIQRFWLENEDVEVSGFDEDRYRIVNLSEALCIIMDQEKPVITSVDPVEDSVNQSLEEEGKTIQMVGGDDFTVSVTVESAGDSGIRGVWYSRDPEAYKEEPEADSKRTKAAKRTEEGKYEFSVNTGLLHEEDDFYIWAVSGSRMGSEPVHLKAIIDKTHPTVTILNPEEAERISPDEVTVRLKAEGTFWWPVKNVYYGTQPYEKEGTAECNSWKDGYSFRIEETPTQGAVYYVWAKNWFGHKSECQQIKITIDRDEPVVAEIKTEPETENGWSRETVTVQVKIKDAHPDGILYGTTPDPDKAFEAGLGKNKAGFSVDEDSFQGSYYIWARDAAGNRSHEPRKVDLKLDRIAPSVTSVSPEDPELSEKGLSVINANQGFEARLSVEEKGGSGVGRVCYSQSREDYEKDRSGEKLPDLKTARKDGEEYCFDFAGNQDESAEAFYYVWVCDRAGNFSECRTIKVIFDREKPQVEILNKAEKQKLTKNEIAVHVKAEDLGGSGVKDVFYSWENDSGEGSKARYSETEGTWIFILDNKRSVRGDVYVWAVDRAGNRSESDKLSVNMDVEKPVIKSVSKSPDPENGWNKSALDITVEFSDTNPGGIYYNTTSRRDTARKVESASGRVTFRTDEEEFNGNYYIWAFDQAGNETARPESVDVRIDLQDPEIRGFEIQQKNTSTAAQVIHFLSFGIFCNEEVEVGVTAEDIGVGSGIQTVVLYGDGQEIAREDASSGLAEFTLSVPFNKELSAMAIDNAGHESDRIGPEDVNPSVKNSRLVLETDKPVVTIEAGQSAYRDGEGKDWYAADTDLQVKVEDKNAGIYSVEVLINDTLITADRDGKDLTKPFAEKTMEAVYHLSTLQASPDEHGGYQITVKVTDNAGNLTEERKTLYMDVVSPEIAGFEFLAEGNQEAAKRETDGRYAYYFREKTKVVITAADEEPSSGIKAITYYAVDYTLDPNGARSREITVPVDANNQITFSLAPGFKGSLYAKAVDFAGNVSQNEAETAGIIVETPKAHREWGNIELTLPETDRKDPEGLPLYAQDVEVAIKAADSFSGLRSLSWSVESDYDQKGNGRGEILIDGDGLADGDTQGFRIASRDKNLITGMKGNLKAGNNSNHIRVTVTLTDRAGNTSEQSVRFSIDKTAPKVEISYDNNAPDDGFLQETQYFKDMRTASVTVTERNFDKEKAECLITGSNGAVPALGGWREEKNEADPDQTTYTAQVVFQEDGDYTFQFQTEDMAGNQSEKTGEEKFTIDRTAPEIEISFDQNEVENSNYYKEQRTATITITEHNFETGRIEISGTAKKKGSNVEYPGINGWTTSGDKHSATVTFPGDALYTLSVNYTDKAGNEAQEAKTEEFYVDRTAPVIKITGLGNHSANSGQLAPVITCLDDNLDQPRMKVGLKVIKAGKVRYEEIKPQGTYQAGAGQRSFRFTDFPHTKESDGMYRLSVEVFDKAGNRITRDMDFSINRFGSVYEFDDTLKEAAGSYVKREFNVVVTETNVDTLKLGNVHIKVIKNGVPSDLTAGSDYTVTESGGKERWKQYRYSISSRLFQGDGKYMIALSSTDAAGNLNENINEAKKAEVWFGVDKTAPVVVPLNIEDKQTYVEEGKTASVSVSDNLVLGDVKIYLNDKKQDCTLEKEKYMFSIPDSNNKQKVTVIASDAAGNRTVREVKSFYVTTSNWVRFVNNKPLVTACAATAAAVPGIPLANTGVRWLVRRRRLIKGLAKGLIKK